MWDFPLFIDEVQTCTSPALARGLSELRKFRIPLLGAHQFTRALPSEVLDAVKGNVGTMIVFRIGADDADVLANEFMPELGVNKDSCKIPADHS
jgi:DNA helicase HerA-like ATPase